MFAAAPVRRKPSRSRPTVSSSHSVHGSAPRNRNMNMNEKGSRLSLASVTAAREPMLVSIARDGAPFRLTAAGD
jgi:hypothetical protein